jgi:hypothetical protein
VFGKSLIPWQRKKTMTMQSEIFASTTSRRRRFTAGWVGARVEELKVGKIIFGGAGVLTVDWEDSLKFYFILNLT